MSKEKPWAYLGVVPNKIQKYFYIYDMLSFISAIHSVRTNLIV